MRQRTESERLSAKVLRDSRGFNLAELAMIVLLVGIMSAVATPLVNNVIQRNRLNGAASKIASDLRYAQSLAVSRGGLSRLNSATADCATVSGQTRYRIERSTNGGTSWSWVTECYLLSSEFQGAALTSVPGNEVRFNSRGTCVTCAGPINVTIAAASGTKTVQVRTTGSVNIQ